MRAILAITLLAVAASAFDFNSYFIGYNQAFNFTQTEMGDGVTCFMTFGNLVQTIKTSIQNKDIATLVETLQGAQSTLLTACGPYNADFATYFESMNLTGTPQENSATYGPQLIQAFTQWVDYLTQGDDFQAGEQEAYIIKVILGAVQPAAIEFPEFNYTQFVQFNESAFMTQYFGAFFDTLGFQNSSVNISAIQACVSAVQTEQLNFETYFYNFGVASDFDGKVDAIQAFADSIFTTVKSCQGAIDINMMILEPIIEAFQMDPVHALLTIANNVGLNLPELIQMDMNVEVDVMTGQYAAAGVVKAEKMTTIFNGVATFGN